MFHQDKKWLNEIIFSLRARHAADNRQGWILQLSAHFALGCVLLCALIVALLRIFLELAHIAVQQPADF
jgi:hypothetical protein